MCVDVSQEWVHAHLDKFKLKNPFKKSDTLDREGQEAEEAHLEFTHGPANLEYKSTAGKYGGAGPTGCKVALDSYTHLHPRTRK